MKLSTGHLSSNTLLSALFTALLLTASASTLATETATTTATPTETATTDAPTGTLPNNCETIKEDIAQRIIANGVAADDFDLTIVANEDLASAQGKQVGYCGNDHYKIFYQRHHQPAPTTPMDSNQ